MLRIRACLCVVAAVLLAGGWLWGQTGGTTKGRGTLPTYWSKLSLTDEQKTKAMSVVTDYRKKIDALKQQIAQLETDEKAELAKILTPEQKKQLQKIISSKVPGGEGDDKKEEKKEEKKP